MEKIPYPSATSFSTFASDAPIETKYGLPRDVRYCKECVISNQRPNSSIEFLNEPNQAKMTIHFDADEVCDACRFAQKKHSEIDWTTREQELRELCDQFRSSDGSYDCIVPGSGGKDSFFASHILKNKFGMHPLTVTWSPHIYTDWGWKNFQSWIHSGQDNFLMTPNGKVHRLLTRLATELLLHPFQPFILGQKGLAPKMAALHKIPLVFYGENEAEYGNPIGDTESPVRNPKFFSLEDAVNETYLGGVKVHDLITHFGLDKNELGPYLPTSNPTVNDEPIQVHYLGYYLKWHPQSAYYYAVEHGGFIPSPERTPGTYSKYSSIDDRIDDLHYYTTGVKFGLGRASYDAAQEIRSRDIDRDEGIALVKKFDHEFPERFIDELFEYLSIPEKEFPVASQMFEQPVMNREYFDLLVDSFRSPHLWRWDGKWELRHPIWACE